MNRNAGSGSERHDVRRQASILCGGVEIRPAAGSRLLLLVVIFLCFQIISGLFVAVFPVSSKSMSSTLLPGDLIIVTPLAYGPNTVLGKLPGLRHPERGDLVLAEPPFATRHGFWPVIFDSLVRFVTFQRFSLLSHGPAAVMTGPTIQRIVGLPGDTIEMANYVFRVKPAEAEHFLTEIRIVVHALRHRSFGSHPGLEGRFPPPPVRWRSGLWEKTSIFSREMRVVYRAIPASGASSSRIDCWEWWCCATGRPRARHAVSEADAIGPNFTQPASLYIHVPVCLSKCTYCDFFSLPVRGVSFSSMAALVDSTLIRAHELAERFGASKFSTIYVGGGTPTALPPVLLDRLLSALTPMAGTVCEWTVEANPESLRAEHIELFLRRGVTRVSLGVQSLDDGELKILGRPHDAKTALAALRLCVDSGLDVSADLMAGISARSPTGGPRRIGAWPA